jgi:hypothetical protein
MVKKVRKKKPARRAKRARVRTRPSIDDADAADALGLTETNSDFARLWSKFSNGTDQLLRQIKHLQNWSSTRTRISTIKSWRNLHTEKDHVILEVLVACSLPLPEITSFVTTYIDDDEEALRDDWESSAFDLYLATFYMFNYWRRQNENNLDDPLVLQFRMFHAWMQELYLNSRLSSKLLGSLSRLERL